MFDDFESIATAIYALAATVVALIPLLRKGYKSLTSKPSTDNPIVDNPARESANIRIGLPVDKDDEAVLVVQTFEENEKKKANPYYLWQPHQSFEVESKNGKFIIEKKDILQKLPQKTYPFKCFLSVKDVEEQKDKYYARIASAGMTITGEGDPDPERSGYWRIWFLIEDLELHPADRKQARLKIINNCLFVPPPKTDENSSS